MKRGISFAGTFNEFLPIVKPALFYHRHIRVWSEVFGTDSIAVRLYEPASADIVSDFGKNVLNIESAAGFSTRQQHANERVSRDVLEFKRSRNSGALFSERDIERTILRLIDEATGLRRLEPEYYQDFLSPNERAELLELLGPEMAALEASQGTGSFPPFDVERAPRAGGRIPV